MKRLTRAILRLYPSAWRQRYETELETLIDETGESWQHRTDLLLEALKMRILSPNWRVLTAFALAGLFVSFGISLRIPNRYISTAVVELSSPGSDAETLFEQTSVRVAGLLSRTSLSNIIASPEFNLYSTERRTAPMEDVVLRMRTRDVRVLMQPSPDKSLHVLTVSYVGTSPEQARWTVQQLINRLIDLNVDLTRNSMTLPAATLQVLDPPMLRQSHVFPNRPMIALVGTIASLLLIPILGLIRRAPRTILTMSITAIALSIADWLIPVPHTSRGALVFASPEARQTAIDYLKTHAPAITPVGALAPYRIEPTGKTHLTITATAPVAAWRSGPAKLRTSLTVGQIIYQLTSAPGDTTPRVLGYPTNPEPTLPMGLIPTILAISAAFALASAPVLLWNRRSRPLAPQTS